MVGALAPAQRPSARAAQGPSQRQLRAGELVRHALVEILREEAIADPAQMHNHLLPQRSSKLGLLRFQ